MGTLAQKLTYLEDTKTAIGNAIAAKGGSVTGKTFRQYATEISNLPSGGGNQDLIDLIEGDIKTLSIPSGTTRIRNYAFNDCTGLTSITVEATTPPTLGSGAFTNTNDCPIYVPAASVDTYKAASGWSSYASRIQAIPSE